MEKYDLFSSRKAAELYATKQPELRPEVIDHVLEYAPGRDTLLDVGLLLIVTDNVLERKTELTLKL